MILLKFRYRIDLVWRKWYYPKESVSNCAITAYPDEIRGQIVKATIILQPGYEGSEELKKEIQNHVKRVTAPYKYPRLINFRTNSRK